MAWFQVRIKYIYYLLISLFRQFLREVELELIKLMATNYNYQLFKTEFLGNLAISKMMSEFLLNFVKSLRRYGTSSLRILSFKLSYSWTYNCNTSRLSIPDGNNLIAWHWLILQSALLTLSLRSHYL